MANIILGDDPSCGIKKKILHASRKSLVDYPHGTRVTFRYQTRLCDDDHTVIDDNRKDDKPMELIFGKKFKLEVWETCLQSMRVDEVASFSVDQSLVSSYPVVAKSLRDIRKGSHQHRHHCCGLTLKEHGLGYADLDNLLQQPQPLEFIFELLTAELPGDYNKESWAMDYDEKFAALPQLKEEGNQCYANHDYHKAATKYSEALQMLEQLCIREKPGDEDYVKLDMMKIPFYLNLAQCQLLLNDYYPAIEQTTEVLKRDPDNVKALYRRAKAHVGAWNPIDARRDFQHVIDVDQSMANAARKELKNIDLMEKEKLNRDRVLLEGKIFG